MRARSFAGRIKGPHRRELQPDKVAPPPSSPYTAFPMVSKNTIPKSHGNILTLGLVTFLSPLSASRGIFFFLNFDIIIGRDFLSWSFKTLIPVRI